jgi:hypothetical protein
MRRISFVLSVASTLALAACSADAPDLLAPRLAPADAAHSASAAPVTKGRFILRAVDGGFRGDLATRVASLGGKIERVHAEAGIAVVSNLSQADASALAAGSGIAEAQPDVRIALSEPVAKITTTNAAVSSAPTAGQLNPASAILYSWQWNMRLIGADKAWAAGKLGSPNVTVAIIDTGIDYDALDLNGLVDLTRSTSFSASDDSISAAFFPSRNAISDFNGHGTNVATQVSSKAVAFAGVTSRTTLIGVKVLDAEGSGFLGDVLDGVLWAADHGADVANMSLGSSFDRAGNRNVIKIITQVFNHAYKKGMVIVVAGGNESTDLDHDGNVYDAYCDASHVICVSAVGPATATGNPDAPAFYTNFGKRSIDVAAPGGNADAANGFTLSNWPWGTDVASWVWSLCSKTTLATDADGVLVQPIALAGCQAGNRISGDIGTSQASPHVAGLAALLVSQYGHYNPTLVKLYIEATSKDLGPRGADAFYGKGRIDVAKAVSLNIPRRAVAMRE